ncbi:pkb-activating kinase-like protein, variant 2 [Puccinia graminis f. sp. tritici]|uniref:non-specific serine/threonine protein kinase n=1 Tax=Puccinia graminis f. sp. tritici TaxID=56615 RepID=A0A5B0S6H6_PUCGR|nr:pkb-activating kinase-like protein, variant 2 [Puccinia graminis f. sp. tritici]
MLTLDLSISYISLRMIITPIGTHSNPLAGSRQLSHHPNSIPSFFSDYLLEYAPKGEILRSIKTLGSFSTDCARFYAAQILSAIEHMHSRGVIHRDIKPENILLDSEMRIKIADFGSAKILHPSSSTSTVTTTGKEPGSERSHSFVGTAEYVSPELLVQKVTSKSSDLWAFGCVLFQMITGVPPFRSRSEYLTFQKITHLEYEFPVGFPSDGQDLVSRLLVLEPEMRIGASMERGGIGEIKTHAFFDSVDWDRLWELLPPVLHPGLVVAAAPPPESLDQQPQPGPVYLPEFFQQDLLSPDPPLLPSPDPPFPPPEPHPPSAGLGLALLDSHEHLLTHPVDSDVDLVHQPESKASLGNALSKRKSWLLGAGRRKSKEDHFVYSSSGEMTWAEVYLPNELVIYSSVVNELWGIPGRSSSYSHSTTTSSGKPATASKMVESLRGKKKKKRQLILTDFPRLLCVKEDGKSSKVRVKFEVLFKPLPSPTTTTFTITSPVESRDGGEEGGVAHQRLAEGHCKTPSAASSSSHLTYSSSASHSTATRSHPQQPELASPRAPSVEPLHPPPHQHHLLPNQLLLFKKAEIENPRCFKIETVPIEYNNNSKNTHNAKQQQQQQQQQKCCWFRFEDKSDAAQRWTDEINLAFQVANNKTHKK